MVSPRRGLRHALAAAVLFASAAAQPQGPAATPAGDAADPADRFEALLLLAEASPASALAAWAADSERARAALAPRLADADRQLVQALLAEREGRPAVGGLARQALAAYEAHCGAQAPWQADCEMRGRWQARQLLAQWAAGRHAADAAHEHALAALDLAVAGRDRRRQARSEGQLAMALAELGDPAQAAAHLARARSLAGRHADLGLQQRLALAEATLAWARHDRAAAGQALQRLLAGARRAGSARQQALALARLSEHAVKTGAPQRGLQAAEQGLALLDPEQDAPLRHALMNNAMLARVALGRTAEARRDFDRLQAAWAEGGDSGRQLGSLREFSDALAAAGELKGAVEMYHRERALADRLAAANRASALAELRGRFDAEAQRRRILLLERDNALTAAALANQALNQWLWAVAGVVLALAGTLLLLLVLRVRETRRRLEDHQASLRLQSERDALTGVASRRHAQAVLGDAGQCAGGFSGALLLIDIDQFKPVNDRHGHAVGDQVLAEVARRIAAAVRPQDLVARWGGEEFIVHAPGLPPADGAALAQRLLQAVSGTPVAVADAPALQVTVSLGHGVFPLPPHRVPLSPEQAIDLADRALYTAKRQGRHRATAIRGCSAATPEALRAVAADFEQARQDGRLELHTDAGPAGGLIDTAGPPGFTAAPAAGPT